MKKLMGLIIFSCLLSLCPHTAKAEAYFLKIQQEGLGNQKKFLQTCSPQTSPCTFMLPVKFKGGIIKNILVVMSFQQFPSHVYLHFFWDKTLLTIGDSRQNYYRLYAGTTEIKVTPSYIELYPPLPENLSEEKKSEEKPEESIINLSAQITLETE